MPPARAPAATTLAAFDRFGTPSIMSTDRAIAQGNPLPIGSIDNEIRRSAPTVELEQDRSVTGQRATKRTLRRWPDLGRCTGRTSPSPGCRGAISPTRRRSRTPAAVIVGAPYDSGTSYRSGARMGPMALRTCDYSEHTGSRPHLSLRVDPLLDLGVVDAGDVLMAADRDQAGHWTICRRPSYQLAAAGKIPVVLGGDHTVAQPDITGLAEHFGLRPDLRHPLRCARRHGRHPVRLVVRARAADAPGDRVRRCPRRSVPADRLARLLAGAAGVAVDGRAGHALLRDGRSPTPRSGCGADRGDGDRDGRHRRGLPVGGHRCGATRRPRRAPAPRSRAV